MAIPSITASWVSSSCKTSALEVSILAIPKRSITWETSESASRLAFMSALFSGFLRSSKISKIVIRKSGAMSESVPRISMADLARRCSMKPGE